uniref:Uncharacterized protein n=1 Tax=Lepeophtheirus salmonis TaxID=72036 RepID=A0A0K2UPT2_LEPSM
MIICKPFFKTKRNRKNTMFRILSRLQLCCLPEVVCTLLMI